MKIYTKQGDRGETGLLGGARVPKDDLRIRSYGTLDELNSVLGIAQAAIQAMPAGSGVSAAILRVQNELFQLGAELATPRGKQAAVTLVAADEIRALETEIDGMEAKLPELKNFILPGGTLASAQMHLARTVCRRAEREMVSLHRAEPLRSEALEYLNRLSDYLFVTARYLNHLAAVADVPWLP